MGKSSAESVVRAAVEAPKSSGWTHAISKPSKLISKRTSPRLSRCWSSSRKGFSDLYNFLKTTFEQLPPVRWIRKAFPGWQAGVAAAIAMSTFALIFNISFLVWAARNHEWGANGLGTLLEGNCQKIGTWNKVAHGVINVLSSGLLGLSNYCMQLLASPTRKSVDKAHRKRQWVDIGIQSFRNVWKRHISPWRSTCWLLLATSSAPLHLLWNSVIIFSPSAFSYNTIQVTEGFPKNLPFNDGYVDLTDSANGAHWPDNLHILQQDLPNYERLSNIECKREYAQNFIQSRGDVVVVLKPTIPDSNTSKVLGSTYGGWGQWPYFWLCPDRGTSQSFTCYNQLFASGNTWKFPKYEDIGNDVQYCLSKRMEEQCKLEYGFNITIIVIVANVVKLICCVATYHIMRQHTRNVQSDGHEDVLLITTGDAISSFLNSPDEETKGMSIVEKQDFQNGIWDLRWIAISPMPWRSRATCSSFRAIGKSRWVFGNVLLALIPLIPGFYLINQTRWFRDDLKLSKNALFQQGIGNPSALFLFGKWTSGDKLTSTGVLQNVALANTPQLAMSIAYFFWNGHLTTMLATREYDQFAVREDADGGSRIGLRVTSPIQGSDQEGARFLTIPFNYWAPNTLIWTALHWFASQAIFFARVDILDHWLQPTQYSISQVGYSVLGLLCFVTCALAAMVFGMWIGVRRSENRMPLAATCSGALSAACHPNNPSIEHHKNKVHWGVEELEHEDETYANGEGRKVAHCTFTSGEAYYPKAGTFYA